MRMQLNTRLSASFTQIVDFILLVYFCVFFAHQQATQAGTMIRYASLGAVLVGYLFHHPMVEGYKNAVFMKYNAFVFWCILFLSYSAASSTWSMDKANVFSVVSNAWKTVAVCFVLSASVRKPEDVEKVLKIWLYALIYTMCVLVVLTPFSSWGTERIGMVLGQHSNAIGRMFDMGVILALYFLLTEKKNKAFYIILMGAFTLVSFLTGSKNAILMLIFMLGFFYFLISGKRKRILVLIGIILASFGTYWLVMNHPVLYSLVGRRIERMLAIFTGGSNVDGSTWERMFFIRSAWKVFREHPRLGIGLNNFSTYLASIGYRNPKYSHSGYLELLSTLGLVGFAIYYFFYLMVAYRLIRPSFRRNMLAALMFTLIVKTLVFDVTSISMYNYENYIILMLAFNLTRWLGAETRFIRWRRKTIW